MRVFIFFSFLLGLNFAASGQNFLFQNQNFFKPYLTNPALAGSQGHGSATLIYKKQLAGFKNSPNSQVISADYPFSKSKIGVGFNLFKDQNGASSYAGVETTFAYHILTTKKGAKKPSGFSFGLSANVNQFRIDLKNFLALGVTDDVFNDESKFNHLAPNFNVGFNFFTHGFFLGVSAYNFLPFFNPVFTDENDLQNAFTVFVSTGLELPIKDKIVIRPSMLVRTQENADYQLDILGEVRFMNAQGSFFSLAPVYRNSSYRTITGSQSVGLNALVSKHPFGIGYQFDFPLTGGNFSAGDHVFSFTYQLTAKPKITKKKK
jgi:type IX secretion system PorP/SprF family membrane protein